MRKLISMTAAAALALAAVAPGAQADDRRGRHDGGYYGDHSGYYGDRDNDNHRRYRGYGYGDHGGYYRNRGYYDHRRRDNDDDEAIAAGVIGLVLGLALGAAATSQPRQPAGRCYDNYQRCDPPRDAYRGPDYDDGATYDRDYGPQRPQCTRRERQWDRYANRYVTIDVPC